MNIKVDKLEHSMVKLTIEMDADKFDAMLDETNENMLETANRLLDAEYPIAVKEAGLDVVALPSKINIIQMGKGQNFIFEVEVAVKPEVVLGQYKEIEVEKIVVEVTDEDIMEVLLQVQETNAAEQPVSRAVVNGDIVNINYAGTQNGVAFAGGTAEGCNLEIGSHSFIAGFEEQIIGHNVGDEFDIDVVFPEQYHAPDLAGKPAVFAIKLNEIKEKILLPIDDNFAQTLAGLDTLDALKESIKAELTFKKENEAVTAKENAVVDKVIDNAEIDIPQPMIDAEAKLMFTNMTQRIQELGMTMDQYLQVLGQTQEEFLKDLLPNITKTIKTRLVLETIVKEENIEVSDEELEAEYAKFAQMYQTTVEQVKELTGNRNLRLDIAVQKAITLITESAKEI